VAFGLPDDLLACAESLRWVQALSAGVNTYDMDALDTANVVFTTVSGIHAQPIAEQVLGYIFAFERGVHTSLRQQQRHIWERYMVGDLADATLGIVGVGSIGQRVAELASAVGMETLVHALQNGWIRGAALDVFSTEPLSGDLPLWDLSYIIVTPHMAGLSPHYMERSAAIVAENYRSFVAGDLDAMTNRIV
jgi:phosphoglycerate dehydrogenase-like enzyme